MEDKILIPFAPILVESTRSIGYSFEAAISDVIDNSIGKGAKNINIYFQSISEPYIAIVDDACGMDEEELESAMRYGSQSSLDIRDEKDLGRFGLGLKMASLSQCRKLTVLSKKNGKKRAVKWDLDHIKSKQDWALLKYNDNETDSIIHAEILNEQDSGTIVLWEVFDRIESSSTNFQKKFEEYIDIAREHISLVFHRFLSDENSRNRIVININNAKIEPIDPFLSANPATQPLIEHKIIIEASEIVVKPYILPHISKLTSKDKKNLGDINDLRQKQGFYIYRNKRLIIWGTWFRLIKQYELNKLARVRVDIPNTLDSIWEIDIKKSTASLPDIIKRNLAAIVEDTVGKSERVYKYRGRKVSHDSIQHVWNTIDNRGHFQYLVNRDLPLFQRLDSFLDDEGSKLLDSFIKMLEDSFPYGDVYYRIAKNETSINDGILEFDEVYKIAIDMIEQIKTINGDVKLFIASLDKIDFFMRYPDVINALREEFAANE